MTKRLEPLLRAAISFAVFASVCRAQTALSSVTLTVTANSYAQYPSLVPITLIDVGLSDTPEVRDAIRAASGSSRHWDCSKASSYKVSLVDTKGKVLRDLSIASVNVPKNTHCSYDNVNGIVQLKLNAAIGEKDFYQVTLQNLPAASPVIQSKPTMGPKKGSNVSFTATPQDAPGEALTNGSKRDTGQLSVSFSDLSLFSQSRKVDWYAKSSDLFSTDQKDSKSAFLGTVGVNHGILNRWYSPGHVEAGMQGNQIASNLSALANGGITTLLPWTWSRKALVNPIFQMPLSPDLVFDVQYTHRIRQNPGTTKKPLARNDFAANPALSWSSISLPWTCHFMHWLNGDPATDDTSSALQFKYCTGVELNFGTWYLPLDLTSNGTQRVEGYGDLSILIPLAGFKFASGILPHVTPGDYTNSRIRIKYSDSVNAPSNYVRSKGWTYGIELAK